MTINQMMVALEEITVGMTTTVFNQVVTRLAVDRWEVGSFGKEGMEIAETAGKIIFNSVVS